MADKKSCEGKYFASKEALEIRNQIWEKCLERCFELTPQQVDTIIELYKKQKQKPVGEIKVDIDVSDALKGLKAVQREARKATAALKELDEQLNVDKEFIVTVDGRMIAKFIHDEND
jgi:hypothetical protein